MEAFSSSETILPKLWQVFINFRGEELGSNFISHLVRALEAAGIKYFMDTKEVLSEDHGVLLRKIEQSEIALVIFSTLYAESEWCLDELVKIMEQVKEKKLRIIPVFFDVTPEEVREQKGEFGLKLYGEDKKKRKKIPHWEWRTALESVPSKTGLTLANFRNETEFLDKIIDSVKKELAISRGGGRREQLKLLRDLLSVSSNGDIKLSIQNQRGGEKLRSSNIQPFLRAVSSTSEHGRSPPQPPPPQYQVFINFRGDEVRNGFLGFLEKAMKLEKINVFTDEAQLRGTNLQNLFKQIEGSRIGVAIFSERYTESCWCLDELVKMKELMDQDKLVVIPVFYKVDATACKNLEGPFGDKFRKLTREWRSEPERIKKWQEALASVCNNSGLKLNPQSDESTFVDLIVEEVKRVLLAISAKEGGNSKNLITGGNSENAITGGNKGTFTEKTFTEEREEPADTVTRFGVEQRLKQLEEKLQFDHEQTRIVGVVGMPGIGKTVLAKKLYEKWEHKFKSGMFFPDVGKMSKEHGLDWLQKRLMQELLKDIQPNIGYTEDAHELWKDDLLNKQVFVVLDDVSGKRQIEFLLGKRDWIKKGSKIVVISSDESLLQDLVDDTYVVPRLNSRDSSLCFTNYAFGLDNAKGKFMKLSRNFLDYAKGNPLALKALGLELRGKNEAYWEKRIITLTQSSNKMIQDVLKTRYNELTSSQKDAFLDVACFFKSENATFVRCVVDSCDSKSTEDLDVIRDLTYKFLVNICGGRVEMHDLLCTFAKEIASQALAKNTSVQFRLWNYQDMNYVIKNKLEMKHVRGVFLDMSEVPAKMSFDANIFRSMCNLLYLRIYSSAFLKEGTNDFKIDITKELRLPLDEVRYLHWVKFPLEKLPSDFNAKKLVNLELPCSSIKQVWEGVKDTPKLKWVDLSNSRKLSDLSGLSKAQNLERLNLEDCTKLINLPQEMENMKSLIFLNMRGCKRLRFLPIMKLSSLKILILSGCSKLQEFEVISENLEALYLDGTALKELPPSVGDLERLSILNLKGCDMLESLPECLGKQKALEELILSGCSKLESVPKDVQNMRYLRILLLDGTRVKEIPKIYSLQRLCLSRNNAMTRLQSNISQLNHLKWLDLNNCENLRYLPTLPPNLEFFNACDCERLEAVTNPLALRMMTEQIRSTFFFTNCSNLEQDARDVISSYSQWKCHRLALECYNRGVVSGALFNLCYPGFEVPSWFHHQAVGSILETRLQQYWFNKRLSGIALCAVVSFHEDQDMINTFSVKCRLKLKNEDGSHISLDCDVGDLTKPGRMESDHVFLSYASCLPLTKRLEDQNFVKPIPTKAVLEFYVTDGCKSEVVNCGISFVYAEPQIVPVEANRYISSAKKDGGWMDDFLGYIFLAFFCIIIFAPHYYLRFLKFFWPLLVLFFCLLALGMFMEWKDGKPKQQKSSETPGTG